MLTELFGSEVTKLRYRSWIWTNFIRAFNFAVQLAESAVVVVTLVKFNRKLGIDHVRIRLVSMPRNIPLFLFPSFEHPFAERINLVRRSAHPISSLPCRLLDDYMPLVFFVRHVQASCVFATRHNYVRDIVKMRIDRYHFSESCD